MNLNFTLTAIRSGDRGLSLWRASQLYGQSDRSSLLPVPPCLGHSFPGRQSRTTASLPLTPLSIPLSLSVHPHGSLRCDYPEKVRVTEAGRAGAAWASVADNPLLIRLRRGGSGTPWTRRSALTKRHAGTSAPCRRASCPLAPGAGLSSVKNCSLSPPDHYLRFDLFTLLIPKDLIFFFKVYLSLFLSSTLSLSLSVFLYLSLPSPYLALDIVLPHRMC